MVDHFRDPGVRPLLTAPRPTHLDEDRGITLLNEITSTAFSASEGQFDRESIVPSVKPERLGELGQVREGRNKRFARVWRTP